MPARRCVLLALASCLALSSTLPASSSRAQPSATADTERELAHRALAGVRAIGKRWDQSAFDETVRLYTEVHEVVEWPGVLAPEIHAYGERDEQSLRLFRPEQGFSEPGPVFVFLHGNGLGNSDQIARGSDDLIYSHIGKLGARFGGIGVTANYRPAEQAGAEDLWSAPPD